MADGLPILIFKIVDLLDVIGIIVWHAQEKGRPTARPCRSDPFFHIHDSRPPVGRYSSASGNGR